MRSLILSFSFTIIFTFSLNGQSDDCTTATMLGAADLISGTMTSSATTADNSSSGFWGGIAPQMNLTCDASNTYTIDEWWRIDIATGNDIMIDITSATNHMVAIVEASTASCAMPNSNTFLGCMDQAVTTSMIFENCFAAGNTYYIVVLTDVANKGPYDLTVTEVVGTGTSALASGDDCMNAISLDPILDGTDGTTITCGADNVSGTSINNFQEAKGDNVFNAPCIEDNEATVWYSFTAGDDVYIENTTSVDLSVALYSGICGALTLIDCDANGNIQEVDALVPGNSYYIQVAFPYGFDGTFDIFVKHNINGRSLGLEKALPVDVYLNGDYAFTFNFGESVSTSLPADNYFIEVKLAGTDATVMTLGPADIPAGADVTIRATLSGGKTPVLKANIK